MIGKYFKYSSLPLVISGALLFSFLPVNIQSAHAAACAEGTDMTTSTVGSKKIVEFTKVGTCTWAVPSGVTTVEILVIAGGGGGGYYAGGGGGGAGEFVTNPSISVGASVGVVVGSGGSAGAGGKGGNGGISSFGTVQANGGGGGGSQQSGNPAQAGGSGGGGGPYDASGANASKLGSGFGNNGGAGVSPSMRGGGGGGAGGVGGAATSTTGGAGGTGKTSNISGATKTYAAGGAGGGTVAAVSGPANTGNGGGGAISGSLAGAGGSGIVIVSYNSDLTPPTFSGSSSFSVTENTSTSTNIATVSISESSTITLAFGVDSSTVMLIYGDSVTTYVRFISSPNFESPTDVGSNNVYDFTVKATDSSGNFATQVMSVTVTDVNEAPVITNNTSAATFPITQAENISLVADFNATDVDAGATLIFSISGTDSANFTIETSTGVLTFITSPDFEGPNDSDTNNIYLVTINVFDGAMSDTQALTITVSNVNESALITAPTVSGLVYKGIATTITVTTNVAGKVRFMVGGKKISTCLARNASGSYPIFTATCMWKPSVRGSQALSATVIPTDSTFFSSTSSPGRIVVISRTTRR